MKTRHVLATSLLLCMPLLAAAAAPTPLTPEQTFDLYARVMLEDDAAAARTLNDALRPAFDGQDSLEFNKGAFAGALAAPLQGLLKARVPGRDRMATACPARRRIRAACARRGRCRC